MSALFVERAFAGGLQELNGIDGAMSSYNYYYVVQIELWHIQELGV